MRGQLLLISAVIIMICGAGTAIIILTLAQPGIDHTAVIGIIVGLTTAPVATMLLALKTEHNAGRISEQYHRINRLRDEVSEIRDGQKVDGH